MSYYVYMLKSQGGKSVTYVGYTKNIKEGCIFIILEKELNLPEEELGN